MTIQPAASIQRLPLARAHHAAVFWPLLALLLAALGAAIVLPIATLLGGVYLVLVDLLGPQELPVGIVTAALGGPFFGWLLRQRQPGGAA